MRLQRGERYLLLAFPFYLFPFDDSYSTLDLVFAFHAQTLLEFVHKFVVRLLRLVARRRMMLKHRLGPSLSLGKVISLHFRVGHLRLTRLLIQNKHFWTEATGLAISEVGVRVKLSLPLFSGNRVLAVIQDEFLFSLCIIFDRIDHVANRVLAGLAEHDPVFDHALDVILALGCEDIAN